MMKKIGLFCIAALLATGMKAQNDITVHDDQTGKDEVIGLPEGMTYEIDSLFARMEHQELSGEWMRNAKVRTRIRNTARRNTSRDSTACPTS